MKMKLGGGIVRFSFVSLALLACASIRVDASIAYGTINNFDCVNDTGVEAHGFEIELVDIHSTDVTYTYDYNHYGIPKIREDNTDPVHPRVFIRYAATRNPDGTWSAYTAIPSGTILPTDGHQFTNPSINFGGEHFGAGYFANPTAINYNWLIDDLSPAHNLIHGPPVYVGTPVFVYNPPAPALPVPQVVAVIQPPPPQPEPVPPPIPPQFGDPIWVKDIKTTSHNTNNVEITDLIDPDPDHPEAHNWANGEQPEVETEWRMLQTEFANANNPKNELKGAPEDLPGGDEIITRRYEFYKYTGPLDAESGEAVADEVGPDGIHGIDKDVTYIASFDEFGEPVEITTNISLIAIVGDFTGAQMAAFDVAPQLGLIDHVPDGELNVPYADRRVVISAGDPFFASFTGNLPDGTTFDPVSGIFSGTPTALGEFTFTVNAEDFSGANLSKTYTVKITGVPTYNITTASSPPAGGNTSGGGTYNSGDLVALSATPNPGYTFASWTEAGTIVSFLADFAYSADADHSFIANFDRITYTISISASPAAGGIVTGGGIVNSGDPVTLNATANVGYKFANWTEAGAIVSLTSSYNFAATGNRTLVANFTALPKPGDVNGDGLVTQADLDAIVAARNKPASGPNDPRDLDHDGKITVLDARIEAILIRQQ